ncbi:uncharacterized protein MELLADRAFT_95437 [Melampsora larici-populina 98AG31]|uniref:Uncharacterized protein n=1 Tax=Melampsora larici-populina (strain 98AG31 / pathotype 3-4-7) TaxID=747676 RepID=F4S9B3_MELLP|nr:uncharacterized protein MELLADRAFT_95437 [Melampsora larici-populina 98AG31]EGF98795.1 hypothetical protein MELLADRAFT_95437 [Melampsora larici-populina 98AG31]
MSGNSRKNPGSAVPKLKLSASGTAKEGKPNVNVMPAQGEITSPPGNSSRRASGPESPTQRFNNNATNPSKGSDLRDHPLYHKVQTLPNELKPFLCHDWKKNRKYNLTKLKYYSILYHFNTATTARPNIKKELLENQFKTKLLPQLQPFCTPPPSNDEMDTDDDQEDFDPLHRSTTIAMLVNTIHSINPTVNVSSVALKDKVLVLYKHYVNPDLPFHQNSSYTAIPRTVKSKFVSKLSTQAI